MKWVKENKEKLQSLIIEGYTYKYISELFNVTPNAIRAQCLRQHIKSSDYKKNKEKKFYCLNCEKEFTDNVDRKFCGRSCSASFNNKHISRKKEKYCLNCGKEIEKRGEKYCSSQCQSDYQYKTYIKKWKNNEVDGNIKPDSVSRHIRKYLFKKYNYKCCKCGWNKINKYTNKIPLQINHIDGDYKNNKEENLELICPNCHSLTENYGARNKGNGRPYRQELRKREM